MYAFSPHVSVFKSHVILKSFCAIIYLFPYIHLVLYSNIIGMTLVDRIIYASIVPFYDTSSMYVPVTPKQTFFCHHIFGPLHPLLALPSPSPLVSTMLWLCQRIFICFSCLFICSFQFKAISYPFYWPVQKHLLPLGLFSSLQLL